MYSAPKERSILAMPGRAWLRVINAAASSGGALDTSSAPPELGLMNASYQALPGLAKIGCSVGAQQQRLMQQYVAPPLFPSLLLHFEAGLIQCGCLSSAIQPGTRWAGRDSDCCRHRLCRVD